MEKLRMAKSAFEQASTLRGDPASVSNKTAVGLSYLAEALMDISTELQEMRGLLNKARKDRNETSERSAKGQKSETRQRDSID